MVAEPDSRTAYQAFAAKSNPGKKWGGPYTGEEGSYTFYIGNGKTVSIYSQQVTTVEKKQESFEERTRGQPRERSSIRGPVAGIRLTSLLFMLGLLAC